MWEGLTVALSCVGFAVAFMMVLFELPAVLKQIQSWSAQHRPASR